MIRRRPLLGAAALAPFAAPAHAQPAWQPSRPIRIIVPFPPGGATDVVARVLGQGLGPRLGQPVVIENRAGANGTIGTTAAARAEPDGTTLVMGGVNTNAMNDALYRNLPYRSDRDFAPIAMTAFIPIAFVVNPERLPLRTLGELVQRARVEPGALSYGSSGAGGPHHLAMELFKQAADLDIVHVPYAGGAPQLSDLLAGHIGLGAIGLPPAMAHIRERRLRALATTGSARTRLMPDLPTVAESGVAGFAVDYWLGLMAPAGTPDAAILRLHAESVAVLEDPAVIDTLAGRGAEVATSTPRQLAEQIATDLARWREVTRRAGISLD